MSETGCDSLGCDSLGCGWSHLRGHDPYRIVWNKSSSIISLPPSPPLSSLSLSLSLSPFPFSFFPCLSLSPFRFPLFHLSFFFPFSLLLLFPFSPSFPPFFLSFSLPFYVYLLSLPLFPRFLFSPSLPLSLSPCLSLLSSLSPLPHSFDRGKPKTRSKQPGAGGRREGERERGREGERERGKKVGREGGRGKGREREREGEGGLLKKNFPLFTSILH